MLTSMLATVFILGLSSFTGTKDVEAETFKRANCRLLMTKVYLAYESSGYNSDEAFQAAVWAYEGCAANGGDSGAILIVANN